MQQMEYKLVRSRRRSVAIIIGPGGTVTVRAPMRTPIAEIERFLAQKRDWIAAKQRQAGEEAARLAPIEMKEGEAVPYLGGRLILRRTGAVRIRAADSLLLVPMDAGREALAAWMKGEARRVLTERVRLHAGIMRVRPAGLRITSARTRWGSCSAQNSLNFCWRLVMCPLPVIDYVVVHELSHILHKDHSPAFWACVQAYDPAYKEKKAWLKENRRLMDIL